ncbi:TPA: phage tail tube protein [Haemophilus influenzae]
MATCETKKIDSNVVGLNYAVEECLGQLPNSPKWQALEPNSFSDFGGELSTTNRTPLSISRQNQKGVVTDLSVKGGFNIDFTQNNLNGLLEGLFFADTRKKAELKVTAVTADGFTVTGGNAIKQNDIVKASGFKTSSSNKNFTVQTGSTDTKIKVGTLTAGNETGLLQVVGHAFASGDLKFTVENGIYGLSTTTKNLTELNLIPGEWIFVGGDQTNSQFQKAGTFYARIDTISQNKITFDNGTFKTGITADDGENKLIEIYLGSVLKNENTAELIKRKSYCFERTLGKDLSVSTSTGNNQAEYISGAVLGEFSLEVKQGEMLNADLSFTATNNEYVTGTLKSNGKLTPSLGESGINTSSDIRSIRLSLVDSTKSTSTPLFAYVTEASIEVNNNLSENKALGTFGAIDVSAGNFEVSGKTTAYFTSVKAIEAVRKNADVGLYALFATKQKGFIFDIPLVGLSGGTLNVEKDNPITLELEASGAENKFGYTMMYVNFPSLPKVAM